MNQAQTKVRRFNFMKQLAEELVKTHLARRVNKPGLHRELQGAIRRVLKMDQEPSTFSTDNTERFEIRKTCSTCNAKKKRKTYHMCFQCKKPICVECSQKMCVTCRLKL